ncbi:MAG: nucleoside triphosphate pyrophosphohydrolase [Betaproteobacteria bacterium]|nr:nucleoside triphosphate pyrophosphohydrolase [Betaproteobacteria bacterium]
MKISSPHAALDALLNVIERLIGPDGCPWDKEQTPQSLADYCIEESYELVAAIRSGNLHEVREELGDLLFLLLFLSRLYADKDIFTLKDVLETSAEKMIRRHPHVFGNMHFDSKEEQLREWERIKRHEKAAGEGPKGIFASLPTGLPPLLKAYRIHSRAARAGFTWPEDEEVERQMEAEWLEFLDAGRQGRDAQSRELGDLLFTIVELGRRKGIKASEALDLALLRFVARFEGMEKLARERGLDFAALSLDDKDELWNEMKALESPQ